MRKGTFSAGVGKFGMRSFELFAALLAVAAPIRAVGFVSLQNANNINLLQLATGSSGGIQNTSGVTANEGIIAGSGTIVNGTGGSSFFGGGGTILTGTEYYDLSGQATGCSQASGGCVLDTSDLSNPNGSLVSAAASNYSYASGLAPTQTVSSTITGNTTLNATGGVSVISFTGGAGISLTASGQNLTLNGSASDIFVLQISGSLNLGATNAIQLTGGLTAQDVLLVFTGTTAQGITLSGGTVNGTLLVDDPNYTMYLSGTVNGLIAGAGAIQADALTVNGGSNVFEGTGGTVVSSGGSGGGVQPQQTGDQGPEPGTWVMLFVGLGVMAGVRRVAAARA